MLLDETAQTRRTEIRPQSEFRRHIRWVDARRPVPVMVHCERQAPCQARAGIAALKSQPVRDRRPSRRPERTPTPSSQSVRTERRAVRRHQPDRKTKSRRSCAGGSSVHRRVSRRGLVVAEKNCF